MHAMQASCQARRQPRVRCLPCPFSWPVLALVREAEAAVQVAAVLMGQLEPVCLRLLSCAVQVRLHEWAAAALHRLCLSCAVAARRLWRQRQ